MSMRFSIFKFRDNTYVALRSLIRIEIFIDLANASSLRPVEISECPALTLNRDFDCRLVVLMYNDLDGPI